MKVWMELNLIIAISYVLFFILEKAFSFKRRYQFQQDSLKVFLLLLCIPAISWQIPVKAPLPNVVSKNVGELVRPAVERVEAIQLSISRELLLQHQGNTINGSQIILILFLLGMSIWSYKLIKDFLLLRKLIQHSTLIKKKGKIKILAHSDLKTPCSFWLPFTYYVLLPEHVLTNTTLMYHGLAHELQHHRQGDTKLLYGANLLIGLFYLNPFIHLWMRKYQECQEICCDQRVIKRKKLIAKNYSKSLLDVINYNSGVVLNGTWAMASLNQLKRRIRMTSLTQPGQGNWPKRIACLMIATFSVWQLAFAARSAFNLGKMSLSEARELTRSLSSGIPLEVNEEVLKWLNHYVSDPKGKAYFLKAYEQMVHYERFINERLRKGGVPQELLAVPFVESAFRNDWVSPAKAAGLWQFIPSTARNYGLKVTKDEDQRLHVGPATWAAIKYYRHLIKIDEFDGDWRFALIAYNIGEGRLKRAIKERGVMDPWAYTDLTDSNYLQKLTAVMILLKKHQRTSIIFNPLREGKVSSNFGKRFTKVRGHEFHPGLDIKAKEGTPILSPLDGVVVEKKYYKGKGKSLTIDHGAGIKTQYHHLKRFDVEKGQRVKMKDQIGEVGNTGISTGPHLHFEVLLNGRNVDPRIFL